jgi:hypothetical protein
MLLRCRAGRRADRFRRLHRPATAKVAPHDLRRPCALLRTQLELGKEITKALANQHVWMAPFCSALQSPPMVPARHLAGSRSRASTTPPPSRSSSSRPTASARSRDGIGANTRRGLRRRRQLAAAPVQQGVRTRAPCEAQACLTYARGGGAVSQCIALPITPALATAVASSVWMRHIDPRAPPIAGGDPMGSHLRIAEVAGR